jgi:hypothetical protein
MRTFKCNSSREFSLIYGFNPIALFGLARQTRCTLRAGIIFMDHQQPPARNLLGSLISTFSRSRRLEDRIRTLSAQAVDTSDLSDLSVILEQLTAALHDHIDRLRKLAAARPNPPERRRYS